MTAKLSYACIYIYSKKEGHQFTSIFFDFEHADFFVATQIQADFSALASRFQTIFLQGVPRFGGKKGGNLWLKQGGMELKPEIRMR